MIYIDNNGDVTQTRGNQGFYLHSRASKECFDVKIGGKRGVRMRATGNDEFEITGHDRYTGIEFSLSCKNDSNFEWGEELINIGNGDDDLHHVPRMLSARIRGKIMIGGKVYDFDGQGYHDHDWGCISSIQWRPWILFSSEKLSFSVGKFPRDSLFLVNYKSKTFKGKVAAFRERDAIIHHAMRDSILIPSVIEMKSNVMDGHTYNLKIESPRNINLLKMSFFTTRCLTSQDFNWKGTITVFDDSNSIIENVNVDNVMVYYWNLFSIKMNKKK